VQRTGVKRQLYTLSALSCTAFLTIGISENWLAQNVDGSNNRQKNQKSYIGERVKGKISHLNVLELMTVTN